MTQPARPSAGPLHIVGEVLTTRRIGAYCHLTLTAPGIPERFRPGTFVALSLGPADGSAADTVRLGRRAMWIHRVKPTGGYGATIDLVVEPRGPGSTQLAGLGVGERVAITGPLGRPFALPKDPVSCVLIGEGHSAAPLFSLAERLRGRGCTVALLLGAPDEAHLLSALEARRTARSVTVVTADGSVGQRGDLAQAVGDVIARAEADVVYAAGTTATLHASALAAERFGAWSQTALERPLSCATGLCQGCTVPVVGEDGVARLVRACADGPVLRGDRVRWAELLEESR